MIILADKPLGWTSNDLTQYLKYQTKSKKIGHSGTLDPMASGLMILASDDDTAKLTSLTGLDKIYETDIDLSISTDTRDMQYDKHITQYPITDDGYIQVGTNIVQIPIYEDIHNICKSIIGTHPLPLTPYSAKKINGQKMYDLARSGNPVYIDIDMIIYSMDILGYDFPHLSLRLHVASGTYIRSIGYYIGQQCGVGGTLTSLRRTQIGSYSIDSVPTTPPLDSKIVYMII